MGEEVNVHYDKFEFSEVAHELHRALEKFPSWPKDPFHALAIIGEEFGELTKSIIQFTYEPEKKENIAHIREEAIQTMAMLVRFISALRGYDFNQSKKLWQTIDQEGGKLEYTDDANGD